MGCHVLINPWVVGYKVNVTPMGTKSDKFSLTTLGSASFVNPLCLNVISTECLTHGSYDVVEKRLPQWVASLSLQTVHPMGHTEL